MVKVSDTLSLDESEIEFTAVKASGPGGQHVNTTNSAVQLRFDAGASTVISRQMMNRLRQKAGQRMTAEGVIIIQVGTNRSQHRNREEAIQRLTDLLASAEKPPKPRRKTKPSKGAIKRRLDGKTKRSQTKQKRGAVKDY